MQNKDITDKDWLDWHWQVRNRITTEAAADEALTLTAEEKAGFACKSLRMPFSVTPYYASVIKDVPALRKCCLPCVQEGIKAAYETDDPLGEEKSSPTPNLCHKYHNRALFMVGNVCPCYCRYCTRGRLTSKLDFFADWEPELDYIAKHEEIRDVLISGGEPLLLSDEKINELLDRLCAIPHIDIIKIGSKAPITMPMRITDDLIKILKAHNPVIISIHINRAEEITPLVAEKLNKLADNGILMGSQSVLLKGVNDDAKVLYDLFYKLLTNRVRPYYLFQCDPISGSSHFRVPVAKGLEIMDELRKSASGYAIPTYAIDIPNHTGKIAVLPNRIKGETNDGLLKIEDFNGEIYLYPS